MAGCPWFGPWIHLISGPSTSPLDSGSLIPDRSGETAHYLGTIYLLHCSNIFNKKFMRNLFFGGNKI